MAALPLAEVEAALPLAMVELVAVVEVDKWDKDMDKAGAVLEVLVVEE